MSRSLQEQATEPGCVPRRPSAGLAAAAFAAMLSVYFFSYFQRVAVPGTIFDDLQRDLDVSAAAVAALGSMFTWIYGGMQVAVGLLTDRYGGARTLMGGGFAMLAGSVLFPLTHTVWWAFAARALTGFGASFMYLSVVKETDRLFGHRHFTVWVGVMLAVGYSGGMAATLPFARATGAFGWRLSLLVAAALLLVALVVAGLILGRLGREAHGVRLMSAVPVLAVLKNRACRPLLASACIMFPIFFVVQTVLGKKFLQDFGGLSSSAAAAFVLVMTAVSAVGVLAGGGLPRLLRDRRKPIFVTGSVLLVVAGGVLLAGVLTHAPGWVFLAGYVLLAVSNAAQPSGSALMKELNPPESVAASLSVVNGLAYIGCGTIAQLGGLILDLGRAGAKVTAAGTVYPPGAYAGLFVFLTVLAGLNLLFAIRVPETHGRHGPVDLASELSGH